MKHSCLYGHRVKKYHSVGIPGSKWKFLKMSRVKTSQKGQMEPL